MRSARHARMSRNFSHTSYADMFDMYFPRRQRPTRRRHNSLDTCSSQLVKSRRPTRSASISPVVFEPVDSQRAAAGTYAQKTAPPRMSSTRRSSPAAIPSLPLEPCLDLEEYESHRRDILPSQ